MDHIVRFFKLDLIVSLKLLANMDDDAWKKTTNHLVQLRAPEKLFNGSCDEILLMKIETPYRFIASHVLIYFKFDSKQVGVFDNANQKS